MGETKVCLTVVERAWERTFAVGEDAGKSDEARLLKRQGGCLL